MSTATATAPTTTIEVDQHGEVVSEGQTPKKLQAKMRHCSLFPRETKSGRRFYSFRYPGKDKNGVYAIVVKNRFKKDGSKAPDFQMFLSNSPEPDFQHMIEVGGLWLKKDPETQESKGLSGQFLGVHWINISPVPQEKRVPNGPSHFAYLQEMEFRPQKKGDDRLPGDVEGVSEVPEEEARQEEESIPF